LVDVEAIRILRGRNEWSSESVLESILTVAIAPETPASRVPGVSELAARLPDARPTEPAERVAAARLALLRSGDLPFGMVPEALGLVILGLTGSFQTFAATRLVSGGRIRVAFGLDDEAVDRRCVRAAWGLLSSALDGRLPDVATLVDDLIRWADEDRLGPSTRALVAAARDRGIPTLRIQSGYSLMQYGWGSRQRRCWTTQTDRTPALGAEIASNKQAAREFLGRAGLPVPPGRVVRSPEEAWAAALELGRPVVVKPRDANRGRGVSTGLTTQEQVAEAFDLAARVRLPEPADVLVERQVEGAEHRLLVVGDRMIAAYRCEPPTVIGDGRRSIAELVAELNRDPRRGVGWRARLPRLELDEQARLFLATRGLDVDTIVPEGQRVAVRRAADLCLDVTDEVHPAVADRAIAAAALLGLDVAGIDVIARDIGRPLESQDGALVEVNTGPCLTGHLDPDVGKPRDVAKAILAALIPEPDDLRIPTIAVAGGRDRPRIAAQIAQTIADRGLRVGLAAHGGRRSGGCPRRGSVFMANEVETLLRHPQIDAVVLDVSAGGVREQGLGLDRCGLLVWTGDDPTEQPVLGLLAPASLAVYHWPSDDAPLPAMLLDQLIGTAPKPVGTALKPDSVVQRETPAADPVASISVASPEQVG
jgi:cyanophycin synthetase